MSGLEPSARYFEAWNSRDAAAVAACFSAEGVYRDPVVPHGISGQAIAGYAAALFEAFPDLSFELQESLSDGAGRVVARWLMRGTNRGRMQGLPPTGATLALPGVDFISVEDEKLAFVDGFFDQRTFAQQLGLQVTVQPKVLGPVKFGQATHVSIGNTARPAAFSLTVIQVRDDEERQKVIDATRAMYPDLVTLAGFISTVNVACGDRLFTITAWEDEDAPKQLRSLEKHREAMNRVYGGEIGEAGMTGVWKPYYINRLWLRCPRCGRASSHEENGGACACGEALPSCPYW